MEPSNVDLSKFGFRLGVGSAHTARTMMLEDIQLLLKCVSDPDSSKSDYLKAIREDNCLEKLIDKLTITYR